MSKHFRIKFSPIDVELNGINEKGEPVKIKTRLIEKQMLCMLFDIAGSVAKSVKENRVAADNFANIDAINMDDENASILLTEEDYQQLIDAHKAAATTGKYGRPAHWNRLRSLLSQLEKPAEDIVK